jgi:16S rRNA (cytidine1402-2'-O)-methyltransferase
VDEVQAGHLYVVATPIGNLGDLSPRAQAILSGVTRIAAEDTRTTSILLQHFGIRTPLQAFHEHNEDAMAADLVKALQRGDSIALVSDAGTPLVSDPGFALVRAARDAAVPVIALPGPCAAIAALSIAGLPTDRFVFEGFLPPKGQARQARLRELASEPRTLVLYESSHRILDCAQDLGEVFGARRVCLAREISKRFEQSVVDAASSLPAWLQADPDRTRGEFVLVVQGAPAARMDLVEGRRIVELLVRELPAARAAKLAAAITGIERGALYEIAVGLSAASR